MKDRLAIIGLILLIVMLIVFGISLAGVIIAVVFGFYGAVLGVLGAGVYAAFHYLLIAIGL